MGAIDNTVKNLREYMDSDGKVDIDGTLFFCGNAILDLAARLDEAEKRIEGLYDLHAVKLPPTGSIKFGPVRNDAKPSPDKQEMFSKQEAIEAYAERIVAWYAFPEPDELRQILSDLIDEALS